MSDAPTTVFYHADCLDGFGAAYAAWRYFGEQASYRPLHHGQTWEVSSIAGHHVFILDFSFLPDKLKEIASLARSVTQIDHHLSALKDWPNHFDATREGDQRYAHPDLSLQLIFDLGKSGARLAWEFFHPAHPTPLALRHIEEQDLWRFQPETTRPFCRALHLLPFDFATWDEVIQATTTPQTPRYQAMLQQGEAIERFFQAEVRHLAESQLPHQARVRGEPVDDLQARRHGYPILTDGPLAWRASAGLAANANALFASELGNLLAEKSGTWGMVWHMDGDGQIKVSLRAKGAVDVAAIAKRYGGGGHRNAAGFRLPDQQFKQEILGLA